MDLKDHLTDEEFTAISTCQSEREWDKLCTKIKQARGGYYPKDWYERILKSGLMHQVTSNWRPVSRR